MDMNGAVVFTNNNAKVASKWTINYVEVVMEEKMVE